MVSRGNMKLKEVWFEILVFSMIVLLMVSVGIAVIAIAIGAFIPVIAEITFFASGGILFVIIIVFVYNEMFK